MVERDSTRQNTQPTGGMSGTGQGNQAKDTGMKQQAGEVASQVKDQAAQIKDQVAEKATSKLDERKDMATSGLSDVSQVVRQTSDELRSRDQVMVAGYIDQAAEQLERATKYLRGRDVREMVSDVESFARREPALFLGGTFALGLLAARFLKSSGQATGSGTSGSMGTQGRSTQGTQAAISSYSSYNAMSHTQPMAVVPGDVSQSASRPGMATPPVPSANPGSFPTPTAGGGASARPATSGVSGVGTGGSIDTTRPSGTTSSRSGAPDWQGGSNAPSARPSNTEPRANSGTNPVSGRPGDGSSTSNRSGGDADA
jgi:hypothetical protein